MPDTTISAIDKSLAVEMRIMYEDVLKEGERPGVAIPHFQGFQAYVERVDAVLSAG
jgi:hypothetical protein